MNFEKDSEAIKEKLQAFKNEGYDRIHISGGTSKEGSHYCGLIGYCYDEVDQKLYFIGLPYRSIQHMGEDSQKDDHTKKAGETKEQTAVREFFEETGLKVKPEDLILVYDYEINDNREGMKGQKHSKYFFLIDIEKCSGELHSFEGANPIDPETMAPILLEGSLFLQVLFVKHKSAVKRGIEKILSVSMAHYNAGILLVNSI
jgi:ADP-ribose pyrophosphatase YjhB (NUDIX family)